MLILISRQLCKLIFFKESPLYCFYLVYFGIYFSPIIFFLASTGVGITALYIAHHLKESKTDLKLDIRAVLLIIPALAFLIYFILVLTNPGKAV